MIHSRVRAHSDPFLLLSRTPHSSSLPFFLPLPALPLLSAHSPPLRLLIVPFPVQCSGVFSPRPRSNPVELLPGGMEVSGSGDVGLSTYAVQMHQQTYEDDGCRGLESSSGGEFGVCEDDAIQEPYEGMEFESEDAAKIFYDEYARRVGFVMRVMSCRRSERDGRILARRLGCNKEGYCTSNGIRGKDGSSRKSRVSSREGCKAMIHVKYDKSGKWVITKFVKDHNHLLVVSPREARHTMDEKDKKIQELTAELRNKKRLCAIYQEQLAHFVKIVEEHCDKLSVKISHVVNNVKEFESIEELLHKT